MRKNEDSDLGDEIVATKVSDRLASRLAELESKFGVSKSLLLRQTTTAVLEALPIDRVCRLEAANAALGTATLSAKLSAATLEQFRSRFPGGKPGELLRFAAEVACSALRDEPQVCLPLCFLLYWHSDVLDAAAFKQRRPDMSPPAVMPEEVFVRGRLAETIECGQLRMGGRVTATLRRVL